MPATTSTATPDSAREGELAFQADLLQRVSRTYAVTIPRLPAGLREAVSNAYLLCRIADTIEDECGLGPLHKEILLRSFTAAVAAHADADAFAAKLRAMLSEETPDEERILAENAGRIVRITHGFSSTRRRAIEQCLREMARGMIEFQRGGANAGLRDMAELERYCHHVAGVVAGMLAELFRDHSPAIAEQGGQLMALAPAYGHGLQLTNILKDIWIDLARGSCWLPRAPFLAGDFDLNELRAGDNGPAFAAGFDQLVAAAHDRLRQGLDFILLIPERERGIRLHLLLTLGMAALSLRRVYRSREFRAGGEFPQPKRSPKLLTAVIALLAGSDQALRRLFGLLLRGVPRS